MFKDSAVYRRTEASGTLGTTLWLAGIAVFSALALSRVPLKLLSEDFIPVFVVALLFALLLLLGLGSVVVRDGDATAAVRRLGFLIWGLLLICEVVFDHTGSGVDSSKGKFSVEAYGEAAMWVLAFGAVAVISLQQRTFLRQLFSGPYKWVAILALVSAASCVLSPGKMYSL